MDLGPNYCIFKLDGMIEVAEKALFNTDKSIIELPDCAYHEFQDLKILAKYPDNHHKVYRCAKFVRRISETFYERVKKHFPLFDWPIFKGVEARFGPSNIWGREISLQIDMCGNIRIEYPTRRDDPSEIIIKTHINCMQCTFSNEHFEIWQNHEAQIVMTKIKDLESIGVKSGGFSNMWLITN